MSAVEPTPRLALADYQKSAVDGLLATVRKVAEIHERNPKSRRDVSLKSGVTLLQAPTGSGKTLMLGRTLEALRGALPKPVAWFWFSPYAGLVAQTRDALIEQCGSLRIRDIYADREPSGTRDGDVFIQTWAAVAARNKDARKVRRSSEDALSLDDMLAALRSDGFMIGVVIDEAHLNFGASARAAAEFYLEALQPDFSILATATPNDDKLEQFEKSAGIEVASRVVIGREEVVAAGLNKYGLMLGYLRFQPGDEELIDIEQGTLTAGWSQHQLIKSRLAQKGLSVTPLMLVQVEDQASGDESPVDRVKAKLLEIGVPESAIAVHTSGEPDPEFHTLAYDPSREVLIFKVAVATGFDAPRAWTLVSVRPSRGKDFGLQIVGRIIRVHPLVRRFHGTDALLDRAYVFLTDTSLQEGLSAAVDELKAVRQSIELLTDQLDVVEFGDAQRPLESGARQVPALLKFTEPKTEGERQERLSALIEAGVVKGDVREHSVEQQNKAIEVGEYMSQMSQTPLFGDLAEQRGPFEGAPVAKVDSRLKPYDLRKELGIPDALIQEVTPQPWEMADNLVRQIAIEFCRDAAPAQEILKRKRKATLSLRDLFLDGADEDSRDIALLMSNARIADKAQLAFSFNDSIDPRELKRALVERLREFCDEQGIDYQPNDLRRAIDLAVMREPERLKDAMRVSLARQVVIKRGEPIPTKQYWREGLKTARKSGYGVFPERLNNEERAFAEFLDEDNTGTVKWWLKNPESEVWATRLLLPTGRRFFPDFIIGVEGRSTPDKIALVEIKDDGSTGRLQSDQNTDKIRVRHREYGPVFWTFRDDGTWVAAHYSSSLHRIIPEGKFEIANLVFVG
jgi:type III restriction enzyme